MRRQFTSEFNLKDLSTFGIEIDKKSNPVVTKRDRFYTFEHKGNDYYLLYVQVSFV